MAVVFFGFGNEPVEYLGDHRMAHFRKAGHEEVASFEMKARHVVDRVLFGVVIRRPGVGVCARWSWLK